MNKNGVSLQIYDFIKYYKDYRNSQMKQLKVFFKDLFAFGKANLQAEGGR